MVIPFMNLARQHEPLREQFHAALDRVLEHGTFILGPEVKQFERDFAAFQDVPFCLGTSNGTTALHLALTASGIGPGDEVIVPVNTFTATAEAVAHCGANPVFVDMAPDTYLLDSSRLEAACTPRTRAIVPVHLYGCPAPMAEILAFAESRGLIVIEDAAQAHGAELNGQRVGAFGKAAVFSFYPGKNLGALGDAGAVVTRDPELYERMRLLRNHGAPRKYYHDLVGYNYRMDSFTGAILGIKLQHLEEWTERRRARAAEYRRLLEDAPLVLPVEPAGARHVYHLFVVQLDRRAELIEFLERKGIASLIHYPIPLHLQKAFARHGHARGDFPVAEAAAERILSLPLCAEITPDEVENVCAVLREGLAASGR